MKTVRKHIIESRKDISDRFYIVPPVTCKDGFRMSVQHSSLHYCSPRIDFAERQGYTEGFEFVSYEVGYPSEMEEILLPYAEDPENPTGTVYPFVPQEIVEQVAEMHGGLVSPNNEEPVLKLANAMCEQGLAMSFAEVRRLVDAQAIMVNGKLASSWDDPVRNGDVITCGKHKEVTVDGY